MPSLHWFDLSRDDGGPAYFWNLNRTKAPLYWNEWFYGVLITAAAFTTILLILSPSHKYQWKTLAMVRESTEAIIIHYSCLKSQNLNLKMPCISYLLSFLSLKKVTTSLLLGGSFVLALVMPEWQTAEDIAIKAPIRFHDQNEMDMLLGIHIGLSHVNITLNKAEIQPVCFLTYFNLN